MEDKNTISCHQAGVLAGILLLVLKLTNLPSIMYEGSEFAGVISIFIVCILNILFLWLILRLKEKYKNMSVFDIFSKYLTKIGAKIVYILLFVFFMFKLLSFVDDGFGFIRDVVDEEFTYFNFIICFFPVICAFSYSGIRNLSRTTEFFYPFILMGMFIAIVFSFAPINFFGLGSVSRLNIGHITDIFNRLSFWNGDLFVMLIFIDKIDLSKGKKHSFFSPIILASLFLIVGYAMYFSLYQQTSTMHVNMIFDIVEYSIGTSSGWHMDIFAILVYMMCLFLQGGIYMYASVKTIQKIFNFDNIYIIYPSIVILIVSAQFLYMNDYLKYVVFAQKYLSIFSSALLILIPLLVIMALIINCKNKVRKHEKNAT